MRYSSFTPYDIILVLQGLSVTVGLFLATTVIGLLLGTTFGVVRYYRIPVLHHAITALCELLKNSPVLVQLFLVFFGWPALTRMNVTPVAAATFTLSLNTAAFVYVIAVSAIQSVGRDQLEAARVFGHSHWQVLTKIITPQAAAFAVGPIIALMINQLQVTSLISVIGVVDLTKIGNILNMRTMQPFIVWGVVGLIYYAIAKLLAVLGGKLEIRLRNHSAWKGL
jgi:glutamine transport system permease protein